MAYGYGSYRREANGIYEALMTGSLGSASGDPFSSPFTSSTWSGSEPTVLSLLTDLVLTNTLGTRNLFRMPAWNEPRSGELGAYAYSQFRANQGALGAANAAARNSARSAFGGMLAGNRLTRSLFGLEDEDVAGFKSSIMADESGFVDMGVNLVKQFMGLEDYGYAGIRAAQRRGGFLLSGMSRDANRMLTDLSPVSSNWASREASVVGEYQRRVRNLMYEGDTFLRNENFMRGFKETDIAPILERVAASARGGEGLEDRLKDVGGAAIKTLEAFKDLFGSAETAKQVLNQMTAGGWGRMDASRLADMSNQVRGLMRLGELNGLSPQAVGGMLLLGQNGVRSAMGYTPSDVAGGYVNHGVVNSVAGGFIAQRMADMRLDPSMMDPIELQRLQARSVWRATQFAGSTAGRSMMAYEFALATGRIDPNSEQAREIRNLFASGDQGAMARAARMTAGVLGVDVSRLQSDAFYKLASDVVGRYQDRLDDYANLGVAASDEEDRIRVERTFANEALDMAKRRAGSGGVGGEAAKAAEQRARIQAVVGMLESVAPGSRQAQLALQDLTAAVADPEKSRADVLKLADRLVDTVGPEFAAAARTNAAAAAARAVLDLADGRRIEGFDESGTGLRTAVDFIRRNGGDVSGGVRRADAVALGRALYDTRLFDGDEGLRKIVNRSDEMSDREIRDVFSRLGDKVLYAETRGVSFNTSDFGDLGTSMKFGGDIAAMVGNGISVRNYWTDGGRGTIGDFDTIIGGIDSILAKTGSSRDAFDQAVKEYRRAEGSGDSKALDAARLRVRKFAGDLAEELSKPGTNTDEILAALKSVHGFEGVTDVGRFLEALAGENGEGVDITFGGKHLRRAQVESVLERAAAGISIDGMTNPFEGLRGSELIRKAEEIQKRGSDATADEREYLRALQSSIAAMGTDAKVLADSVLRPDGAFGAVAMSRVIEGFGGELVAADSFGRAAINLGDKSGMSAERVKALGASVQKIVDNNAVEAYATASQAILRGLTTGTEKDMGAAVDMFLAPGATPEQKAQFMAKLKKWVDSLGTDENGNKRTPEQRAAAVFEGVASGEVAKLAASDTAADVNETELAEWRKKAEAMSDVGTSRDKPAYVWIVNGASDPIVVHDVEN